MKFVWGLIFILLLSGCAARSVNNSVARNAIINLPQGSLEKADVDVVKVSTFGGSEAIAETRLKTAFRLEKIHGEWIVREVRVGHGQWEKISNITEALQNVKIEETRMMLDRIAEAIRKYRDSMGSLPTFSDYIKLSDQLSPVYLTPLIRLDAWRNPFSAEHPDANTITVTSAGPDGIFGTKDDISKVITH